MNSKNRTLTLEISTMFFGFVMILGLLTIGICHMEHVENTRLICEHLEIPYELHTNFFGNVTRIYVKQ